MSYYMSFSVISSTSSKNKESECELLHDSTNAKTPEQILSNLSNEELHSFKCKTERRFLTPDKIYTIQNVHGFTQFQSCFLFGNYLNQLLGCPVPCINPKWVFNGTFLHNMYTKLEKYSEIGQDKKLKKFFESDKYHQLENLYESIVRTVQSNVPKTKWDIPKPKNLLPCTHDSKKSKHFNMFDILGSDEEA